MHVNKDNAIVNQSLTTFIFDLFLKEFKDQQGNIISQNKYAKLCGLSSSTITKLKDQKGYDIPMSTIYSICRHEGYSLKRFFTEFEKKYGENLPL